MAIDPRSSTSSFGQMFRPHRVDLPDVDSNAHQLDKIAPDFEPHFAINISTSCQRINT
jgi:hypothetical protein